ncbi:HdeD family acid-resistance protein [Glaciihabitans sp. dw_435]|uniref:HdeD family acid-resistance protein n=1 Tax=Glaciihabitans sp. dw_435 TaxID=2720081 RepID=UPI001BD5A8AA|nr:DUF308 domain-containing protein [Glaciihabitans sp. dw_435]
MTNSLDAELRRWRDRAVAAERGWILTLSLVAVMFGVFVMVRPSAGMLTIAIFFGIYLVVTGAASVAFSNTAQGRSAGRRWIGGILGALVIIAGFICLLNLSQSLQILGLTLGVGLILAGIADMANVSKQPGRPVWLRIVSGVLTILAGIIMVIVPLVSVGIVVVIGGVALIVAGIAGLFRLTDAPDPSPTQARQTATDPSHYIL